MLSRERERKRKFLLKDVTRNNELVYTTWIKSLKLPRRKTMMEALIYDPVNTSSTLLQKIFLSFFWPQLDGDRNQNLLSDSQSANICFFCLACSSALFSDLLIFSALYSLSFSLFLSSAETITRERERKKKLKVVYCYEKRENLSLVFCPSVRNAKLK